MSYKEIEVFTQNELDEIPLDFHGRIFIKFGTLTNKAVVRRKYPNSSVEAFENSSVVAWENSSVEGSGNAQILDAEEKGKISVKGNARIVYNPKTPTEYAEHYDLTCSDGYMRLFKAVRKQGNRYLSDRDLDFEYFIGETAKADGLDKSRFVSCGKAYTLRIWPGVWITEETGAILQFWKLKCRWKQWRSQWEVERFAPIAAV